MREDAFVSKVPSHTLPKTDWDRYEIPLHPQRAPDCKETWKHDFPLTIWGALRIGERTASAPMAFLEGGTNIPHKYSPTSIPPANKYPP